MLLLHQTGAVKVGEVVRYTVTYNPSLDRILPIPPTLHLRIRNTTAAPLRAAYLHGPYTLHVASYPSIFQPNCKLSSKEHGIPQYESQLKAGGSWDAKLCIPETIRNTAEDGPQKGASSVTWIVEVTSQIIFSSSATVHYELFIGRDESALGLAVPVLGPRTPESPGKVEDHQQAKHGKDGHHASRSKGVFSKAIHLVVEDTASLWNKPAWPSTGEDAEVRMSDRQGDQTGKADERSKDSTTTGDDQEEKQSPRKPQRVHLVLLTHGLHSNLSADMLFLKESIDAAAREAREERRKRRAQRKQQEQPNAVQTQDVPAENNPDLNSIPSKSGSEEKAQHPPQMEDEDDEEEVIVRGCSENILRTERGIKYLGKRLAKFVLRLTYPRQPFLPIKRPSAMSFSSLSSRNPPANGRSEHQAHANSSLYEQSNSGEKLQYEVTSISFIGHSLGGLVQTYAIAYIQKHSPRFFEIIKPINFIALASPFLGLSSENPMYVKFALDFGLVGRTGQDLGLAWSPPNLARSGWSAILGGLGAGAQKTKNKQHDPGAKPLLRILPTGPGHQALTLFQRRTIYSNIVGDGIVPLRTSCLLFLDYQSLERVEMARRENFLGSVAEWGWAELTGANATAVRDRKTKPGLEPPESSTPTGPEDGSAVPEPSRTATRDDAPVAVTQHELVGGLSNDDKADTANGSTPEPFAALTNFLASLLPGHDKDGPPPSKESKIFRRSQTVRTETTAAAAEQVGSQRAATHKSEGPMTPPRTGFFESASALLNPPLPPTEFLVDPSKRPRTIIHDRLYKETDIPPLPPRRHSTFGRSSSGSEGGISVEEKIARAYHRDMSWRKVLVRLEPDAHNNIVVRRMFGNAYGWPVIKHLCDSHFSEQDASTVGDDQLVSVELAKPMDQGVSEHGEEVRQPRPAEEDDDEARDTVSAIDHSTYTGSTTSRPGATRRDSVQWSDADFEVTDDEDDEVDGGNAVRKANASKKQKQVASGEDTKDSARPPTVSETHVGLRKSFEESDAVMEQVTRMAHLKRE
ncbi:MAG: hypothetical protein M1823_001334 [Watsoniomyces obsoletus]|nr:MAG: hypothetical protein M1823_001334 [Watsoniomyces obsoletus]